MDLSTLIQALAQQAGVVPSQPGSAPSYADAMAQRRQFVQQAEGQSADAAQNAITNGGVGGVRISSQDATSPLINFHTDNANKTAALFQTQQANLQALTSLLNDQANRGVQQQQMGLTERGQNLQYYGDPNGPNASASVGGQQANLPTVAALSEAGAKDILAPYKDNPAQQLKVAHDILAAGGVAAYRKAHPQDLDTDTSAILGTTNETLSKIQYIKDRLQKSPALKAALDNPVSNMLLQKNNKWITSDLLKLSPEDQQALGYMTNLNATNDRSAVGGRLDNYLLQRIGPSGVGVHQKSATNLKMLDEITGHIINDNLTPLATQKGYGSVKDLPYIDFPSSAKTQSQGGSSRPPLSSFGK